MTEAKTTEATKPERPWNGDGAEKFSYVTNQRPDDAPRFIRHLKNHMRHWNPRVRVLFIKEEPSPGAQVEGHSGPQEDCGAGGAEFDLLLR